MVKIGVWSDAKVRKQSKNIWNGRYEWGSFNHMAGKRSTEAPDHVAANAIGLMLQVPAAKIDFTDRLRVKIRHI